MATDFNAQFIQSLKGTFPKTYEQLSQSHGIKPMVFSPFQIELPSSLLTQVKQFVQKIYQIKESESYKNNLISDYDWSQTPVNSSVLSSFDFHYSPEMGLKLIEINTNASLYLAGQLYYESRGLTGYDPGLKSLLGSFQQALQLKAQDEICILDREPHEEGLYFEFLLYKEWFEQNSLKAKIISLKDYSKEKTTKVYNRLTDFYFSNPDSQLLEQDYKNGNVLFSPNPREYVLMADKKRLNLFKRILEQESSPLSDIIPETKLFSEFENAEDLWQLRKKFFFKPSESFGGKGVFNGKGISRKAFDEILHPQLIAQELCPADKKTFQHQGESVEMKYDLRFYTFDGEVQQALCRLYQGQATNMRTVLGGISPLIFN